MLNSVSETVRRTRLTRDDRRRQLLGIGLAKLVDQPIQGLSVDEGAAGGRGARGTGRARLEDKPIQDLSVDEVAAEAGISRGLLFHYFPTKRDFYRECLAAAGRRILRTTAPDPDLQPEAQVRDMVRLFVDQIDRRRDFYL